MSQPLAPRTTPASGGLNSPTPPKHLCKIFVACGACKQRKTKCSGGRICNACATRHSACVYDVTSDQRRKTANQRNIAELAEAYHDLSRYRQLVRGLVAIIKAGDSNANVDLARLIRDEVDLSQLAAHVRSERRSNLAIQQAYESIEPVIDGPKDLPSPTQILKRMQAIQPALSVNSQSGDESNQPAVGPGAGRWHEVGAREITARHFFCDANTAVHRSFNKAVQSHCNDMLNGET